MTRMACFCRAINSSTSTRSPEGIASGQPRPSPPRAGGPLTAPDLKPSALWARFDLSVDQAAPAAIDETIRAGVPFRGTNLWVLIFAIFIASIGLNVNSTAVIIGAMLISPLMGPIIGAGYGVGVGDLGLVRTALQNLAVATGISLATSALYFVLTPLSGAHSELLARTAPTIWDVLIALFGGLAGVIGMTRRERGNVVPGVAIATALMPPLCTAGYGLASGNLAYFAGAFYLFFINSVFIATATFMMVRVMRLPEAAGVAPAARQRAHRIIGLLVFLTATPSVYLAVDLIQGEVASRRAESFLSAAFPAGSGTFVVERALDREARQIVVAVVGDPISAGQRSAAEAMLPAFGLGGYTLVLGQSRTDTVDVGALKAGIGAELQQATLRAIGDRDARILALEAQLAAARRAGDPLDALAADLEVAFPELSPAVVTDAAPGVGAAGADSALFVLSPTLGALDAAERDRLEAWLSARTGAARVGLWETPVSSAEAAGRSLRGLDAELRAVFPELGALHATVDAAAPGEGAAAARRVRLVVERPGALDEPGRVRLERVVRARTGIDQTEIIGAQVATPASDGPQPASQAGPSGSGAGASRTGEGSP